MSSQNTSNDNDHVTTPGSNDGLSRRNFLKLTTMGAAGATLLGPRAVRAAPRRQATQTLRVVMFGAPDRAKTFDYLGTTFSAANPDVKVEFLGVPGAEWDEFFSKVSTMLASGQNIDLIEVGTEGLQLFASKKFIQPLDDRVQADKTFWTE
jgi:multiple sugar transport system substrate-binding protein